MRWIVSGAPSAHRMLYIPLRAVTGRITAWNKILNRIQRVSKHCIKQRTYEFGWCSRHGWILDIVVCVRTIQCRLHSHLFSVDILIRPIVASNFSKVRALCVSVPLFARPLCVRFSFYCRHSPFTILPRRRRRSMICGTTVPHGKAEVEPNSLHNGTSTVQSECAINDGFLLFVSNHGIAMRMTFLSFFGEFGASR